jgi:3-oxoacyl-[acyl-carrier-protein] synthase-3
LYLPTQAAAETEATVIKWHIAEGAAFSKGQSLAEVESAKATFEFEAPCNGTMVRHLCAPAETLPYENPIAEIDTEDAAMKNTDRHEEQIPVVDPIMDVRTVIKEKTSPAEKGISLLAFGGYLPQRIVTTAELLKDFNDPELTEEYMFGVTGIRERRWAAKDEKPSDMAYKAACEAIAKSGIAVTDIDAIIVTTTTPDAVMPATACILQDKLGIRGVPAFDMNAACSGWLYGIVVARGLVASQAANNVLVVAVDMQSRLLDKKDKGTYFLFGDGAGATIVSGSGKGHRLCKSILIADAKGLTMASRSLPGYEVPANVPDADPWIRLDGYALFRFATESFSTLVREVVIKSNWLPSDVRWVIPHQANGRILKAAAKKSGIPFERFFLNIDRVGNTSSASIPLALVEVEKGLQKGDKIVLCSVGAGITAASITLEW